MVAVRPRLGQAIRATWTITMLVVATKMVLALRDVVLAHVAGVSGAVDLFQLLFAVTAFFHAGLGAVVGMLLVPVLSRLAPTERATTAVEGEGALGLTGIAVAVAVWLAAAATRLFGQVPEGAALSLPLIATAVMCLSIPVLLVSGSFVARLQLAGSRLYIVAEMLPALTGILLLLLERRFDLPVFCAMFLVGTAGQATTLAVMLHRRGERIIPALPRHLTRRLLLSAGMGWLLLGQGIVSLQLVLDPYIAASLGEGSVSRFAYGSRIINIGVTLAVLVIGRALAPTFSLMLSRGEASCAERMAWQCAALAGVAGSVAAVIGFTWSSDITALIFYRADFLPGDATVIADFVRYGCLLFPPCLSGLVLLQLVTARQAYRTLCLAAILSFTVKYLAIATTIATLGLLAIPIASIAWYAITLLTYATALLSGNRSRSASSGTCG